MKNWPETIEKLYRFLDKHQDNNKQVQENDIRRTLAGYDSVEERALRLLYEIVNTQSQPKLDPIAKFFKRIRDRPRALASYESFSEFLGATPGDANGLFNALKEPKSSGWRDKTSAKEPTGNGWGDKTSALFVRNLAVIAGNSELSQMFWPDIQAVGSQNIQLPVDAVVKAIFRHLRVSNNGPLICPKADFKTINEYLLNTLNCDRKEMLVWDDLWFWGFITQKSKVGTDERDYRWNEAKYWSIFTAPKAAGDIAEIELLATGRSSERTLVENFLTLTGHSVSTEK